MLQIAGASGFAESDYSQGWGIIPLWLSFGALAVMVLLLMRERRHAARAAAGLQREIAARQQTETALTQANADLERRMSELPAELQKGTASEHNKAEILAMLAEELREPLAPIRNAVHVLQLIDPADDRVRWARDVIDRQVQQMSRLVEDLVDAARIMGGKINLLKQSVAIGEHGGSVEAVSAGEGHGAEFVVRLPAPAENILMPAPAESNGAAAADKSSAARRLLVVDDNKDSAESLASLLKVVGNEVRTAYDGAAALAAVHTFAPDVVLLDIGLPEMDGYEVARQIRGRPDAPQPLLIALTGYGADEDQRRSYEAGFDHHLTKPVRFNALQAILESSAKTISDLPGSP